MLASSPASASKISDSVTAGNDNSISNGFNASVDLGEVFVLEASWQLMDTDAGKFNTFTGGGDLKLTKSFDVDLLADFAPSANGVGSTGLSLTPTYEIDEGDDFYTALSIPMYIERYSVLTSQLITSCQKSGRATCPKASKQTQQANLDVSLNQYSAGLGVEQGIYDATLVAEISADRYSDTAALSLFGRELKGGARMSFNQVGGLMPTFPVLFQTKVSASYKFRFGVEHWFTLKPLVSETHMVYEADHGYGDTGVAKVVAGFSKKFEITVGYQVLVDRSVDTSVTPPTPTPSTIHYGLIGFAYLFGGSSSPASVASNNASDSSSSNSDSDEAEDPASPPVASAP